MYRLINSPFFVNFNYHLFCIPLLFDITNCKSNINVFIKCKTVTTKKTYKFLFDLLFLPCIPTKSELVFPLIKITRHPFKYHMTRLSSSRLTTICFWKKIRPMLKLMFNPCSSILTVSTS